MTTLNHSAVSPRFGIHDPVYGYDFKRLQQAKKPSMSQAPAAEDTTDLSSGTASVEQQANVLKQTFIIEGEEFTGQAILTAIQGAINQAQSFMDRMKTLLGIKAFWEKRGHIYPRPACNLTDLLREPGDPDQKLLTPKLRALLPALKALEKVKLIGIVYNSYYVEAHEFNAYNAGKNPVDEARIVTLPDRISITPAGKNTFAEDFVASLD